MALARPTSPAPMTMTSKVVSRAALDVPDRIRASGDLLAR